MALKIGDEVKVAGRTFLGVVTCVDYYDYPGISNKAEILTGSGRCMTEPIIQLEKTGRHFPQIAEVLKQLKGRRRGMKLIVEVPEGMLDELRTCKFPIQEAYRLCEVIENGTPLPKGHGRLIDADALMEKAVLVNTDEECYMYVMADDISDAPTIIEADKEYGVKAITRGNCMACGKELTEGVFFCKECEKKEQRKELIDRKALKEELDRNYGRKEYCSHDVIEDIIYHVPTIEERKTGKWKTNSDFPDRLICSECSAKFDMWHWESEQMHYCPNCGAKMKGEEE